MVVDDVDSAEAGHRAGDAGGVLELAHPLAPHTEVAVPPWRSRHDGVVHGALSGQEADPPASFAEAAGEEMHDQFNAPVPAWRHRVPGGCDEDDVSLAQGEISRQLEDERWSPR